MGMYDCLNGEQVKCFYRVIYYRENTNNDWQFSYSGGQLRGYINKSQLPLKTFHYKYPNDFLILDERSRILHTIKDGKLFDTEPLRMIKNIDFNLFKNVYNYNGLELNINNIEELQDYPNKASERIDTINRLYKEFKPSNSRLIKSFRFINNQTDKLEDIVYLLEDEDYKDLNDFFNSLNLELSISPDSPNKARVLIKLLLDSKDKGQITKIFVQNKANELFYRFNNRLEDEEKLLKEVLDPYLETYNKKWIKESNFKTEEKIGRYISVIHELNELRKTYPESFNDKDEESYTNALKEFSCLIEKNGIDSYIEWLNPSKEELNIINDILNNL